MVIGTGGPGQIAPLNFLPTKKLKGGFKKQQIIKNNNVLIAEWIFENKDVLIHKIVLISNVTVTYS